MDDFSFSTTPGIFTLDGTVVPVRLRRADEVLLGASLTFSSNPPYCVKADYTLRYID